MSSTLITNIGELTTVTSETLRDAALVVDGGTIAWIGAASAAPAADEMYDGDGLAVLPGWVDSHTHMVFDGDRAEEFVTRMAGGEYAAGGINETVAATRAAGAERLRKLVSSRVSAAAAQGTTFLETKTGYGLDVATELLSGEVASEYADTVTYLGAHVVPTGMDADEYVDLVIGPMLDAVRPYVQWIDVFCERGAFDEEQARYILQAGKDAGLGIRVHANQLGEGAGVQLAVEMGAASADHLNYLNDRDYELLRSSWDGWSTDGAAGVPGTVATVLPACDLSTRAPLAPARQLLDAGIPVAIASNCNPGTSYTSSMPFNVATAVLQYRLTIDEAVRAATYTPAVAIGRHAPVSTTEGEVPAVGSIAVGHQADIQVLDAPSIAHLAYRPGMPLTKRVMKKGEWIL